MKRTLLLAVVATLAAQQLPADPWLKSLATAQRKAKERNALIFVELFADWCGWCHKMEQDVFPSEAFQKATENKVLLRLNTEDNGEGTQLSQRFSVASLPTTILLTPNGTVAGMIRGYAPAKEYVRTMTETESKYKDFLKRVKSEGSISKDYDKRLDLAREFRTHFELPETESRLQALTTESGVPQKVRDEAYYELAMTQVVGKKYDAGLKTIRKFATVQSKGESYERSRLLAADIYMIQGNFQDAVNEFRTFKANFPKSPYIQNVDVVLPQLEQRVKQP
ncbi:MAG TPA: thioredoxin family protein [Thermoanaerobaculia bacterium]|nr:thioredoxin family protein [Thermoanaerobaculia bacterium]